MGDAAQRISERACEVVGDAGALEKCLRVWRSVGPGMRARRKDDLTAKEWDKCRGAGETSDIKKLMGIGVIEGRSVPRANGFYIARWVQRILILYEKAIVYLQFFLFP